MPYVLLAPDKFKGSLTAGEVAEHMAEGFRRARPGVDLRCFPVADGGDGTLAAALTAGFDPVPVTATGPTGQPVRTAFAVREGVAVIELADVCGLRRLPGGRKRPLRASSYGLGEVVSAALDFGCHEIVLGLGGSASTDGGAGMVNALGVRLLDSAGAELAPGGSTLRRLERIDLSQLHSRVAEVTFVVASDVDNPLLGPDGAAAVYAPQKGAGEEDVAVLEEGLSRWAQTVQSQLGVSVAEQGGAGAAGGVGFAALSVLGAQLRPGIEELLRLLGFEPMLDNAGLVVTGEGSLDGQSLRGKAPVGVASAAAKAGVRTVAIAGQLSIGQAELRAAGIERGYPLTDLQPDVRRCVRDAADLIERMAALVAADWLDSEGIPLHFGGGPRPAASLQAN
jgi:glycerate kinase